MMEQMLEAKEMNKRTEEVVEQIIAKYVKLYTKEIYDAINEASANGCYKTELYPSEAEDLIKGMAKYTAFLYATDRLKELGYKFRIHFNESYDVINSLTISWN